ncbi:MAG: DUF3097 family protein [Lawsonella sp.]
MSKWVDRYANASITSKKRSKHNFPQVEGTYGLVIEDGVSEFCGAIVGYEKSRSGLLVRLEDRHGNTRVFATYPGALLLEGKPIHLIRPKQPASRGSQHSNSGSRIDYNHVRAKTAKESRIWVEGKHDAAIVQQVWGHDLAVEGIVVEELAGLDNLLDRLHEFEPSPTRRIGVLADHLIEGTKEAQIAAQAGENVLITGHPYVDIWEAVKPETVGITAWPKVPMGEDWKTGVCHRLNWGTPQDGWKHISQNVNTYRDLEPALIGAVERLIDFVAAGS